MESILYYLCCFGCFGFCCRPKYVKKDDLKVKRRTLQQLKAITPGTGLQTVASHPTTMKTNEMSDIHHIPNKAHKSANDVLVSYGFTLGDELGAGAQGCVYKAKHIVSGFHIAIKVFEMPEDVDRVSRKARKKALISMKRELFILQTIRHPHIIQMILHFVVIQNQMTTLYLLIQFAEHGDMSVFLRKRGPFDEKSSKVWFAQMVSALVYMHSKGYAHRDLKLSNVLLDGSDDILISDFGLSQVVITKTDAKPLESTTYCGTPSNMPPEVLEKKERKELSKSPYDPFFADVWSLGVILYRLLNKSFPFHVTDKTRAKAIQRMKQKKWSFSSDMLAPASPPLELMMKKIFEPIPNQRPKMVELSRYQWVSSEYKLVEQKCKKWMQTNK